MSTIEAIHGVFQIEIKLDKSKKLVYITASTTPRGAGLYHKMNTGTIKTVLQEHKIDFGRPVKKTTVHNGTDNPDTLSGTWIFELNVVDSATERKRRTRKKTNIQS